MNRTLLALAPALALTALGPADAAPRNDRGHHVALSLSPLHLLLPVFEVQGELLFADHFSASIILGYGSVDVEILGEVDSEDTTFDVIEVGGQLRGYFWGGNEGGAYGGVEFIYLQIDGEVDGVVGLGSGSTVSPLLGYKWTWDNFFIDLAAGVQFVVVAGEAEDSQTGEQATEEDSAVLPNLNFNLGWSF